MAYFNKELNSDKDFNKENKKTIGMIDHIHKHLYNMGDVYTLLWVNMHTMYVKDVLHKANSNMIIVPAGYGKSTFLRAVAQANKKKIQLLPSKCFESFLSEEPKEYFHNKILLMNDGAVTFSGLSTKQRQQLTQFFTELITEGGYKRQKKQPITGIKTSLFVALPELTYKKNKDDFFKETFMDRLIPVHKSLTQEQIREILNNIQFDNPEKFKVKLQNTKLKLVEHDFNAWHETISELAMHHYVYGSCSAVRAYQYVVNFLKANSYLNNRQKTSKNDLKMYFFLHFLHLETLKIRSYDKVINIYVANPELHPHQIAQKLKISRASVYAHLATYKEKMFLDKIERKRLDQLFLSS